MLLFLTAAIPGEDLALLSGFYERFGGAMFREARRYVSCDADAEDTVHDVFSALAESFVPALREKDDESRLRFLLVCAKNRAISFSKRQSRIVPVPSPMLSKAFVHADDELAERMDDRALVRKLLGALDGMDPLYADALFLQLEGASVKEIAGLLGEKPETIKKRLHRARKLLRGAITEQGGTEE